MRIHILRAGVLSLVAAGLVSCGGEDSQPLTGANAATVLAQLNTVLGQLPRSNSAPTLPITGATTAATKPGVAVLAAIDCETVAPTTPVDADADGIAAIKTSTFDCANLTAGGYTYSRKGFYKIIDADDTVAGMIGGMKAEFNVTRYDMTDSAGELNNGSYVGQWTYIGDGSGGLTSTSDFNGHTYYKGPTADYEVDYDYGYTWDWAMKADNSATPWTTGSQSFKGDFTMKGKFVNEDHSGVHTPFTGVFKVSYSSKSLTYDSTCTKWYKSGSIMMNDSNGTIMEIRYACATAELYVNGQKSDWWAP